MLLDLISEVLGAARALLVRAVPEKSGVPGDYDRMCRIASEMARVDFARRRIELLEEAGLLPPEIRCELVSLRERELNDYYKERFDFHLRNQVEIMRGSRPADCRHQRPGSSR